MSRPAARSKPGVGPDAQRCQRQRPSCEHKLRNRVAAGSGSPGRHPPDSRERVPAPIGCALGSRHAHRHLTLPQGELIPPRYARRAPPRIRGDSGGTVSVRSPASSLLLRAPAPHAACASAVKQKKKKKKKKKHARGHSSRPLRRRADPALERVDRVLHPTRPPHRRSARHHVLAGPLPCASASVRGRAVAGSLGTGRAPGRAGLPDERARPAG